MQQRIAQQPAFVLHTRPFRDTSLLADILTPEYGRIGVVARGARAQKSRYRGYLRPFVPILVTWSGRSELVTLNEIEASGAPMLLEGRSLLAGLYLNELLVRLLHQYDPHPEVYADYQRTLNALNQNDPIEPVLRCFEKGLLVALGFGFSWTHTVDHHPIVPSQGYAFAPDEGFSEDFQRFSQQPIWRGAHLIAIANDDFSDVEVLRTAKHIMRLAMQVRLGNRAIRSRELFV